MATLEKITIKNIIKPKPNVIINCNNIAVISQSINISDLIFQVF